MRYSRLLLFRVIFAVLCVIFILSGCTGRDRVYRENRMLMDTICTITVVSSSREKAANAIESGFSAVKRLEGLLNFFSPDSDITAINRASGIKPVKVKRETLELIKKAVEISGDTGGAFDPTVGPLMRLWGFSNQPFKPMVPARDRIKESLGFVDYRKIHINPMASEVFLEIKGMEIDLGGIAKGYAADKAIEAIKAKGVKAALVAVAGDIKGFGLKPGGRPWRVGIQNPRPADGILQKDVEDVFASLYLDGQAISTSGDYQKFFARSGQRYHHILDPATGYPSSGVMSVSVIAGEGYTADGLSTGIFVMGAEAGIKLLESMGIDGVIVASDKKIFLTKNLEGKINFEKDL